MIGDPKRRPVDADRNAVVLEAVEQCLALEQLVPRWIVEIGRNDARPPSVAHGDELEQGVDLFGFQRQVSQLIDQQGVIAAETVEQPRGGAIGQGGVELIEQILCLVEASAITVEKELAQQADGETRLAGARGPDEHQVLRPLQEAESGEAFDLGGIDAGLVIEGEGLQRPLPGELRLGEPVGEAALLALAPFLEQQPVHHLERGQRLGHGGEEGLAGIGARELQQAGAACPASGPGRVA